MSICGALKTTKQYMWRAEDNKTVYVAPQRQQNSICGAPKTTKQYMWRAEDNKTVYVAR
jgi:hypothetical protein